MPVRETSRKIDKRAAEWAVRLDRGELSPEEQAEVEAWAAADTRHLGALARAMAVLTPFKECRQGLLPEESTPKD